MFYDRGTFFYLHVIFIGEEKWGALGVWELVTDVKKKEEKKTVISFLLELTRQRQRVLAKSQRQRKNLQQKDRVRWSQTVTVTSVFKVKKCLSSGGPCFHTQNHTTHTHTQNVCEAVITSAMEVKESLPRQQKFATRPYQFIPLPNLSFHSHSSFCPLNSSGLKVQHPHYHSECRLECGSPELAFTKKIIKRVMCAHEDGRESVPFIFVTPKRRVMFPCLLIPSSLKSHIYSPYRVSRNT